MCLLPKSLLRGRPGQQRQWRPDIPLQADYLCFNRRAFYSPSCPPFTHAPGAALSSGDQPYQQLFGKFQVQLQFSEKQMRSASNVSLVIEAAANSFCAVRAVDQSVLLLKSETELSAETVRCPDKCLPLSPSTASSSFGTVTLCLTLLDCVRLLLVFCMCWS